MDHLTEKIFNVSSYCIIIAATWINFETIKGTILFAVGLISGTLQIINHVNKLREDKKNKK